MCEFLDESGKNARRKFSDGAIFHGEMYGKISRGIVCGAMDVGSPCRITSPAVMI